MYPNHTKWLLSLPAEIASNEALYRSQELLFDINQRQIIEWGHRDKRRSMRGAPAADIGMCGVGREHGVAYLCGDFIEVFAQSATWVRGKNTQSKGSRETRAESPESNSLHRAAKRAQKQIRRITNANRMRYMWTLTMALPSATNDRRWATVPADEQRDYDRVREIFKVFLKRCKRHGLVFPWLAVFEPHDSEDTSDAKRGTWHLHLATPKRIEWQTMTDLWGHGIVRFDDFSKPKKGVRDSAVRNPGAYMSKYIGKNFTAENFRKKRYTRSRDTVLPGKISLDTFFSDWFSLCNSLVYHELHEHAYDVAPGKGLSLPGISTGTIIYYTASLHYKLAKGAKNGKRVERNG